MPYLHRYKIFISHAWKYSESYNRICRFLNDAPQFIYANYSVPRVDPLHCSSSELTEEIRQQIRPVEIVIILAGMYVSHSSWIQFEIDYAKCLHKPILGILPWGSERVPVAVNIAADRVVGWNTASIVSSIRALAR